MVEIMYLLLAILVVAFVLLKSFETSRNLKAFKEYLKLVEFSINDLSRFEQEDFNNINGRIDTAFKNQIDLEKEIAELKKSLLKNGGKNVRKQGK